MHTISFRRPFPGKKPYLLFVVVIVLFTLTAVGYYRYTRPVGPPTVIETLQITDDSTLPIEIPWPETAQASIGTVEDGILASKPGWVPQPTASTAKLITVLTVLKEKPLLLGEAGALLTIDQQDIAIYDAYFRANGSVVAVQLGEQLSQYQMLQGILIRSGNNLADSLAIWAFGSLSQYQVAAQNLVNDLGMTNTTVGIDASGLSPTTTSTAEDLTRIGIAAMKNDVVRDIVRQTTSSLPVDGTKPSTNWMLGQNGVVGIKTGSTPEVGGVFIIASEYTPAGEKPITIVGAIQGEQTTFAAITRAGQLAEAIKPLFIKKTILKKGAVIATISTPWGESSDIVAAKDITTFSWKYKKVTPEIALIGQTPFKKDSALGSITINEQSSDLITTSGVHRPSWWWRIVTSR